MADYIEAVFQQPQSQRQRSGSDLVPVVLVSDVPVVLRSSCVISSWLQYF
jgi:hypothetical protein